MFNCEFVILFSSISSIFGDEADLQVAIQTLDRSIADLQTLTGAEPKTERERARKIAEVKKDGVQLVKEDENPSVLYLTSI